MRNKWDALAPMNIARSKFGAASLDGCIYITGGILVPDMPRMKILNVVLLN